MKKALKKVKKAIFGDKFWKRRNATVRNGMEEYAKTGKTPEGAYMALLDLYCYTNGKYTDELHSEMLKNNPAQKIEENLSGVLGDLNENKFNSYNSILNNDGYVFFEDKLDKESIQKLNEFALKTEAVTPPKYDSPLLYDPENPKAEIYRFKMEDLVNNPDIQKLMMDETFINIARNYLGCEPIFDFPAMWWTTTFSKEASEEAAQLYHFDFDRVKWLKIFIYLNDVNDDNGPHCFVKGSHKTGAKQQELLDRGYVRILDKELAVCYDENDFVKVCADAGSIFAGDTKCWHKGTPLKKGHRLVLEFQYSASIFGTNYPDLNINNPTNEFKSFCEKNKVYSSNLKLS